MINDYDFLTLGDYMKINAVIESDAEDIDKQVRIVAILSGKTEDEVLTLPLADYTSMAAETAFLTTHCKPAEIPDGWRIGELIPTTDFTKITTAQYIDFQVYSKSFPDQLPELLTVFLVPDGKRYNEGYDVADVLQRVKALPFPVALGLAGFFLQRLVESIGASLTSLDSMKIKDPDKKRALRKKMAEVSGLLESAGVGFGT